MADILEKFNRWGRWDEHNISAYDLDLRSDKVSKLSIVGKNNPR